MNDSCAEILTSLQTWAEQQGLVEQALAACRESLIQCAQDDIEVGEVPLKGWMLDAIKLRFERHALIFQHGLLSYPFIETRIGLYVHDAAGYYRNHERAIGDYRLITRLDGSIDDDYLIIDDKP